MDLLLVLVFPLVGAFISLLLGQYKERIRDFFNLALTFLVFLWVMSLYPIIQNGPITYYVANVMGTGLYLKMDLLRYYLVALSSIIWFIVTLYSVFYLTKHKNRNRYYFAYLLTYSFAMGIFLSENLLNLFTFFEAMTFSSYVLIIHDEDEYSHQAGVSYLAMAITGGLIMLMGILVAFDYTDTLVIGELATKIKLLDPNIQRLISTLIVIGFGVKSSMFPLHTWLPKAYVAAPTPGTAVLSGVLLKTGLYGMYVASVVLVLDQGLSTLIILLGIINTLLGGFLAMNQRNVKRIVAYSSMSQAGFMIMGIGLIGLLHEEGGLALLATILYMINHGFAKVLLFLAVGVIVYWLRELSLTNIWGSGRNHLLLKGLFIVGMLGTIGFPGFNGFVSKTLLHEALVEASHTTHLPIYGAIEVFYYIGSTLTVAYMLKLYIALFVSKNKVYEEKPSKTLNYKAGIPLVLLSGFVLWVGLMPNWFMEPLIAYIHGLGYHIEEMPHVYSMSTVMPVFGIIAAGTLLYLFYVRRYLVTEEDGERVYLNHTLNWFNIEEDFFRPFFKWTFKTFTKVFDFIDSWMLKVVITVKYFFVYISNLDATLLKKLEWDRRIIDQSTNLNNFQIQDDLTLHNKPQNLKESFTSFYYNISSINYNVLFVASVMVIIMIILFLVR